MRSWLTFVIVVAALFLGARYAYRHLRPPDPDYQRGEEAAEHTLASLPKSCQPARPPRAESKRGEAAQSFDLYDIKLYIPAHEAVALVSKLPQFTATPDVTLRDCASDAMAYDERVRAARQPGRVTSDQHCVEQITYHSPKEDLELDLVEDLPDQPGCMVVEQVIDERSADLSDNRLEAQLRADFERRFGRLDSTSTLWGETTGAHLMLSRERSGIVLELTDTAFADQKDEARKKIIQDASEKAKAAAKRKRVSN